ncbi:MAG: SGNH/GDSL hydrolase family protein [Acidobacteriaceae bacterium]
MPQKTILQIWGRLCFFVCVLLLGGIAFVAPAHGQQKPTGHAMVTEKIEWTWAQRPEKPNPSSPNVLLLGDSITRGYYPQVAQKLAGRANCYLFATSTASGDPRLAGQLQAYFHMVAVRFRVIHFNNGMHGWGYTEVQYAHGLPGLLADLRVDAPGANLIWASTTPVQNDSTTGGATNARIEARNTAAAKLMRANHIPIDDQFALMMAHADLHSGDVHYTAAGSAVQADRGSNS